jgi:hypothetical protein
MDETRQNENQGSSRFPLMRPKWYRIYPSFANEREWWSIDEGKQDTARHCFKVIFDGAYPGSTDLDLHAPAYSPKAWVVVYGILRETHDNQGRRVFLITKK